MRIIDLPPEVIRFLQERLGTEGFSDLEQLFDELGSRIPEGAVDLESSLSVLGELPVRVEGMFVTNQLKTIRDLALYDKGRYGPERNYTSRMAVQHEPNIGKASLGKLEEALKRVGWTFEDLDNIRFNT